MEFLREFRYIAPDMCKHVEFLTRYADIPYDVKDKFVVRAQTAKILKDVPRMKDAFANLIKYQLKAANINFVIENLPNFGTRKADNLPDRITARSIHDTMWEFGSVRDAVVFKNHAYVWFDDIKDARNTHRIINNMMIENNIISTAVVA
tara:strand:- start:320 stop:766 length:447 start_codon:yes stop_codon:yes gene_type:complete